MDFAVGASPVFSTPPSNGTATAGADAELVRYKKELSDCVNCATATTTEGKRRIQEISSKISAAESRIKQTTVEKLVDQSAATKLTEKRVEKATDVQAPSATANATVYAAENNKGVESISEFSLSDSTFGGLIDIFA